METDADAQSPGVYLRQLPAPTDGPMGTMIQKHELEEADTGKKALSTLRMSEMAAHLVVQVGFQWHLVPQLSHLCHHRCPRSQQPPGRR